MKTAQRYNKSEIFTRAHYLFRTCKSLYSTFGQALSDVWQSARKKIAASEAKAEKMKTYKSFPSPTAMYQPNLSEYYNNRSYTGD